MHIDNEKREEIWYMDPDLGALLETMARIALSVLPGYVQPIKRSGRRRQVTCLLVRALSMDLILSNPFWIRVVSWSMTKKI